MRDNPEAFLCIGEKPASAYEPMREMFAKLGPHEWLQLDTRPDPFMRECILADLRSAYPTGIDVITDEVRPCP